MKKQKTSNYLAYALILVLGIGIIYGTVNKNPDSPTSDSALHTDGRWIKDSAGKTVYLKGVNSHPYWVEQGKITETQMDYMQKWGVNVNRVMLKGTWRTSESYRIQVDNIVDWGKERGIYTMLTIANEFDTLWIPSQLDMRVWTEQDWSNWVSLWVEISSRYKDEDSVVYDPLNEPLYFDSLSYQTRFREVIDGIRVVDSDALVFVTMTSSGGWSGIGFQNEIDAPVNRDNVVFSGHRYYNGQDDVYEPAIRNTLASRKWKMVLDSGKPVLAGEFGVRINKVGFNSTLGLRWANNFVNVMEEDNYCGYMGWAWTTIGDNPLLLNEKATPTTWGEMLKGRLIE